MLPVITVSALLAAPALQVTAKSVIVVDGGSGKVLFERAPDVPRYPASTTKMMTALLLIERTRPDEMIVAPAGVEKIERSSMFLKPGERVRAKDMLYAVLLRSANDGSVAVAKHIGKGSIKNFTRMMNERAKAIGCTRTHFNNPNGLPDPLHTTTARDLSMIAREAMHVEAFRQAVRTQKYKISRSMNTKDLLMENSNRWLAKDPSAEGVKTGYTRAAGRCFVGANTRNGFRVFTVVLGSKDWQVDHRALVTWAFQSWERKQSYPAGQAVTVVPVEGGAAEGVPVAPQETVYTLGKKVLPDGTSRALDLPETIQAPVLRGQRLGTMTLRDAEGFEQQVPLVATEDVFEMAASKRRPAMRGTSVPTFVAGVICLTVSLGLRRRSHGKSTL